MEGMPVFVKIEKYDVVLELVEKVRSKLHDAEALLHQVEEMKNQEDAEIEKWKAALEEVGSKMNVVQQSLVAPGKGK